MIASINIVAQQDVKILRSEFRLSKKGTSKALKNIRYGDFFYEQHTQGGYRKALDFYLEANEYNSENPELNYKIGVCYIESIFGAKALPFLQNSYSKKIDVAVDVEFYLAHSYQLNYLFEDAIVLYNSYLVGLSDAHKINVIKKRIFECESGLELMKDKQKLLITNMIAFNSSSKDYGSLITADGKKMYFTSRRPNRTGGIDPKDDQHFEDIYYIEKENIYWGTPQNLRALNTPGHDGAVGLSHDGNTLILYYNGDLFYSELKGDSWSRPVAFPTTINTNQVESSACFSLDGNTLYFVRGKDPDPKKSNGDIYYSRRAENGQWGEAFRLPDNVNTPYDEDGLFMFADGKTLYFSSKGHNSMGGYDIFSTTINEDGSFSDPVNLGYPLNTPDDDIYFVMESNNHTGYFTSARSDSKGYTDIYQVRFVGRNMFFSSEDNLIASIAQPTTEINLEKNVVVIINGTISDSKTGMPIDAEILIVDNNTNEIIYQTRANSVNGEYTVSVPVGRNYGMVIRKDGYLFQSENFDLITSTTYQEISKDVQLNDFDINSIAKLSNIFFDFASSNLQNFSIPELNRVADFLQENSLIKIEISGHTDNIGGYEENMALSQKRAEAVADYLINAGIDKDRIIAKGYGYNNPIATNQTPEGRQQNRRVEFKIISN
jgi:outer membrane protein OmpA-like peptidoglycan-associated protein